jgi:hypothetical protein
MVRMARSLLDSWATPKSNPESQMDEKGMDETPDARRQV